MWGKVKKFFAAMFSEWGSGLSGPLSVPFTILAIITSGPILRIVYGSMAAFLGFFSAFRIWMKEHDRAELALESAEKLREEYTNEIPRMTIDVFKADDWSADPEGISYLFALEHLSGRNATYVQLGPIIAKSGKYRMTFPLQPAVKPQRRFPLIPTIQSAENAELGIKESSNFWVKKFFIEDSRVDADYILMVPIIFRDGEKELSDIFAVRCEVSSGRLSMVDPSRSRS